MRNAGGMNTK